MYFHLIHVTFQNIRDYHGAQTFPESGRNHKVEGTIWVDCSKFRTEDPYVLGAKVQNLVALAA